MRLFRRGIAAELSLSRARTEKRPQDPRAWLRRADAAEQLGDKQETVAALFRAADLHASAGGRAQVMTLVRRILDLDPAHAGARRFHSLFLSSGGDKALVTRPDKPTLAKGRGEHAIASRPDLGDLTSVGSVVELRAGSVVFSEGEFGSAIYFVLEGTVAVEVSDRAQLTSRRLARLGPGAFFGEIAFLTGARRPATVVTETDVVLLEIAPDAMRERLVHDRLLLDDLIRHGRRRLLLLMAALLATIPPFSALSPERRNEIIRKLHLRRLTADEILIHRGDRAEVVCFVAFGRLEVYRPGPAPCSLQKLERGDVLDALSLATASVRAVEPSCVFLLPRAELESDPALVGLRRLAAAHT